MIRAILVDVDLVVQLVGHVKHAQHLKLQIKQLVEVVAQVKNQLQIYVIVNYVLLVNFLVMVKFVLNVD